MAKVELRLRTFIPFDKVFYLADQDGNSIYFHGDGRGNEWSSLDYRTSQSFVLDTSKSDYGFSYANKVGDTTVYYYDKFNKLYKTDTKSQGTTGLGVSKYVGTDDNLYITVTCDVANPIVIGAPAINYNFQIRVTRTGSVRITGNHDGCPSYEFWRKIDSNAAKLAWNYVMDSALDLAKLAPPMEEYVDKGLSYTA